MKHKANFEFIYINSMRGVGRVPRRRLGIDICAEYERIKQKRSHLSASMRRKVVEAYELSSVNPKLTKEPTP
jgi:hypothetical protein